VRMSFLWKVRQVQAEAGPHEEYLPWDDAGASALDPSMTRSQGGSLVEDVHEACLKRLSDALHEDMMANTVSVFEAKYLLLPVRKKGTRVDRKGTRIRDLPLPCGPSDAFHDPEHPLRDNLVRRAADGIGNEHSWTGRLACGFYIPGFHIHARPGQGLAVAGLPGAQESGLGQETKEGPASGWTHEGGGLGGWREGRSTGRSSLSPI
jgi:hypothetical protein